MSSVNDLFNELLGNSIRRKPLCKTCIYQKKGLTTMCEKYKRVHPGVQKGGYCERYIKNEVK